MSWAETAALIIRARREGVTLTAKTDGKLGLKADRPPRDELLALLKEHKADILALLPPCAPPSVERAKLMIARLQPRGFRAYLDHGALLIADVTGRRRNVAECLPIGEVFDVIVAGIADDPRLLAAAAAGLESEAAADGAR